MSSEDTTPEKALSGLFTLLPLREHLLLLTDETIDQYKPVVHYLRKGSKLKNKGVSFVNLKALLYAANVLSITAATGREKFFEDRLKCILLHFGFVCSIGKVRVSSKDYKTICIEEKGTIISERTKLKRPKKVTRGRRLEALCGGTIRKVRVKVQEDDCDLEALCWSAIRSAKAVYEKKVKQVSNLTRPPRHRRRTNVEEKNNDEHEEESNKNKKSRFNLDSDVRIVLGDITNKDTQKTSVSNTMIQESQCPPINHHENLVAEMEQLKLENARLRSIARTAINTQPPPPPPPIPVNDPRPIQIQKTVEEAEALDFEFEPR
jgi:hypothetical protein